MRTDFDAVDVAIGAAGDVLRPQDVRSAGFAVEMGHVPLEIIVDQVARAAAQRSIGHRSYVSRTLADKWHPHSEQTPARLRSHLAQAFHRAATVASSV